MHLFLLFAAALLIVNWRLFAYLCGLAIFTGTAIAGSALIIMGAVSVLH